MKIVTVTAADQEGRLDRWLKRMWPCLSFVAIQKALRKGWILVEGQKVSPGHRVAQGHRVMLSEKWCQGLHNSSSDVLPLQVSSWRVESWIVYEDEDFLVVNKPSGIASQGGTGQKMSMDQVVVAWGRESHRKDPSLRRGSLRMGHRLDKETSGILIFTKNLGMSQNLAQAFHDHRVKKVYWALVWGRLPDQGRITQPLKKQNMIMVPHPEGLSAITSYRRRASYTIAGQVVSLAELFPKTGRMHQLRAHLQHIGHALLGDQRYGRVAPPQVPSLGASHQFFLHCTEVWVPFGREGRIFCAPLPPAFSRMQEALETAG